MHVGIYIAITESTIRIDELAREVEARGFEALWVPEHTHVLVHRRTPLPPHFRALGADDEPPQHHSRLFAPFITLMGAAAVTQRLRLGTSICLIIQRDTILTAKAVATLDQLSGGRVLFGIGGGWNADQMGHHGTVFTTRFQKIGEQVRAMKEIWTQDTAAFHGKFVNFEPIWCWPKPVQHPHPPVLLGGESSYTLQRVVEYGNGWLPRLRQIRQPGGLSQKMSELRERAAKAGRDMQTISVSVFGAAADPQELDKYRAAGISRAILGLPQPASRDLVLPLLDRYAQLSR
jgi:probable F420-dependent oxidoreductase